MAIDILVVEDEYTEREQLTLLWAGIARLCAESALPPPERLTTGGFSRWSSCAGGYRPSARMCAASWFWCGIRSILWCRRH